MAKQEYLRPHDVTVLLQLCIRPSTTFRDLSGQVALSLGETHNAVKRLEMSRLVMFGKDSVHYSAVREFLISGVPYAFPAQVGAQSRGIPTAFSAPPLAGEFPSAQFVVWEDHRGTNRGDTLVPLSPAAGDIWERNQDLYSLMTLVDALRVGRARERERARQLLEQELTELERR